MALVGNMIHEAIAGNPSIINYCMFVAVFAMLSLIYLIAASINEAFAIAPMFMVIADALNVLFFFAGGVGMAAQLGAHSCSNEVRIPTSAVPHVSNDMAGLSQEQRRHQRRIRHEQALQGISSHDSVPMVRLRDVCRLLGLLRLFDARQHDPSSEHHSKRWAQHVPGLNVSVSSSRSLIAATVTTRAWLTRLLWRCRTG